MEMNIKELTALITAVVYLGIVFFIGIKASRRSSGEFADFAVGNRAFGIPVLSLTMSATYMSSFGFMGVVAMIYAHGAGFNGIAIWLGSICPFLGWILGRRLWILGKKYNYISLADVLGDFYESDFIRLAVAIIGVVFVVPYIGAQMVASGLIFQIVTGGVIPYVWGSFIFLVITVAYVWMGGIRAVAWTDVFQGIFMFIMMAFAIFIIIWKVFGGIGPAFSAAAANTPKNLTMPGLSGFLTIPNLVALQITTTLALIFGPHLILRYYSAISMKTLKWSTIITGAYMGLWNLFTPVIALGAAALMPGYSRPDMIVPNLLFKYLPVIFSSIVIAGALAAAMSTADSQLHAASMVFTHDIYEKVIAKKYPHLKLTERNIVRFGRLVIIVFGIISFVGSLVTNEFIVILVSLSGGGFMQLVAPTIGVFWWKRATKSGAISAMIGGILVLIILQLKILHSPLGWMPILWSGIVNVVLFIIVSLLTSPPSQVAVQKIRGFTNTVLNKIRIQES